MDNLETLPAHDAAVTDGRDTAGVDGQAQGENDAAAVDKDVATAVDGQAHGKDVAMAVDGQAQGKDVAAALDGQGNAVATDGKTNVPGAGSKEPPIARPSLLKQASQDSVAESLPATLFPMFDSPLPGEDFWGNKLDQGARTVLAFSEYGLRITVTDGDGDEGSLRERVTKLLIKALELYRRDLADELSYIGIGQKCKGNPSDLAEFEQATPGGSQNAAVGLDNEVGGEKGVLEGEQPANVGEASLGSVGSKAEVDSCEKVDANLQDTGVSGNEKPADGQLRQVDLPNTSLDVPSEVPDLLSLEAGG